MKQETECENCNEEIIITENNLFFSEESKEENIYCPECDNKVITLKTDGWYFVRTKSEYKKDIEIEQSKQRFFNVIP
ncbi:hypothetical protein [Flavobacterium terrigena]|uniref:Uncharacterized protein n=1 Tax=Flavobacterium terrigena TaxID=402734 RepID=A0A1H6SDQ2_9FLAO|nr:hypothetical protein [Flavobacterium terrigena]SEI62877.1 hypothetical protein SAMN05660918_1205 [Flavobacterium terrigena]